MSNFFIEHGGIILAVLGMAIATFLPGSGSAKGTGMAGEAAAAPVSYTHLTLPTIRHRCRSRWSPYH